MTTLIDWQPEDPAPKKFVFLLSESEPPICAKALLEADFKAREVEELNTLYVATTRARQTLVLSASEAYNENLKSVWHRLRALCTPVVADDAMTLARAQEKTVRTAPVDMRPRIPLTLPAVTRASTAEKPTLEARMGSALHRLLQWQSTDAAALLAVMSEFSLARGEVQTVGAMANQMLKGEAAWLWDASKIDWQANEYELVHEGRVLRIDRLIKHRETQTWWVIDFKSAAHPERAVALRAQLAHYVEAVSAVMGIPTIQVRAAFVTGDGSLIAPREPFRT
jgi:ATP-dependent helicase/nuclease subunit A